MRKKIKRKHLIGVRPYNRFSKSANALRLFLGLARFNPNHKYKFIINWGLPTGNDFHFETEKVFNEYEAITKSINKLDAFKHFKEAGLRTPKITTNIEEASSFKFPVFCRKNKMHKGKGITVANNPYELVNADFYSEYIEPLAEYRVHVFMNDVISWYKKIPKDEYSNPFIRNHDYGYFFSMMDNTRIYSKLREYAVTAINCLGLDFGSVDIILSKNKRRFYVLEVNTASSISGTTLRRYAEKFEEVIRRWNME